MAKLVVTASSLNLREKPSLTEKIIDTLEHNEEVELLEASPDISLNRSTWTEGDLF